MKLRAVLSCLLVVLQLATGAVFAVESEDSSVAAEANKIVGNQTPMLKGQVTYCVPSGTPIKLKLATVPTTGLRLADRDLDGNLLPARLGQKITAKTTEDIYVDDNKVIPEGTIFYGIVSQIFPPKRVGRPGSLALKFGAFKTPDGRKFTFHAEANNTRESTLKSKAKGFGIIMAHAGGGAVVGALVAYQIFGLESTIAMEGYNIAGGAAAGALAGIAVALLRRGKQAVLEPGDELNMSIEKDMLIPAATSPTLKPPPANLPGIEIEILKSKVKKDGLDGYHLALECMIENNTNKTLHSLDVFLKDDNGHMHPVVPNLNAKDNGFEEDDLTFKIEPRSRQTLRFSLAMEFPKLKRKLIWLDHKTRQKIFEMDLP